MACIEKIYSVSAVIGNGKCNANCAFCAGKFLRKEARQISEYKPDRDLYWKNFQSAIKLSARYGGWSLSLTSSGEPTCDPDAITEALQNYKACADQGAFFPNVNLFTNGIQFGDEDFCNKYLPLWRKLGLTNIAVSVHDVDIEKQKAVYGVDHYPDFRDIQDNVEEHGIGVRVTLLLRKGGVETAKQYEESVKKLIKMGLTNITSWPVGNRDGSRNQFTPSRWNLFKIKYWLWKNAKLCHGHSWGGGVYDYKGSILRITDYVTKHDKDSDFVRQLVVFQDNTVCYSWIREGALCLK
jgi:molybdenum cofactor biosynthesis enzyme MoaA